ncbi:isoprenylcysteine carboxylmethyltransferase family protein [Actibacterium sp. MT2.3-13A]|uniref:methyltransferase family protein n=1 Tax=Actibacterium sp. MT2.3-13A TaxID=2828332 RepID=UPI002013683A|nr:isoprenylcysteine carboxylmethyltransferase family protein [Actibacterium sp. MT2.3-13A]
MAGALGRVLRGLDLPPVWLAGFAALAWGQARTLPTGAPGAWAGWLGGALIALGVVLAAAAVFEFLRHRTTVIPGRTPRALVQSGVYRISRNPIYLADAMILAGLCLIWGAISGLILLPAFMALIQKRFIEGEEARIRAEFGATFDRYAARVRRWM